MGSSIGNFFTNLWSNISSFFAGIPEFFSNFWTNLRDFIVGIFVPEDGWFESQYDELQTSLINKIDITEYVKAFNNLQEINEGDIAGLDVNFRDYKIGDTNNFIATPKKWIDFDFVLKYKNTWFVWCRAVTWIFFIIYNINQFLKVLWGRSASDGSSVAQHFNSSSNNINIG